MAAKGISRLHKIALRLLWSIYFQRRVLSKCIFLLPRGGYYEVLAQPGLRVLVMNTNYCYKGNHWLEEDPMVSNSYAEKYLPDIPAQLSRSDSHQATNCIFRTRIRRISCSGSSAC